MRPILFAFILVLTACQASHAALSSGLALGLGSFGHFGQLGIVICAAQ